MADRLTSAVLSSVRCVASVTPMMILVRADALNCTSRSPVCCREPYGLVGSIPAVSLIRSTHPTCRADHVVPEPVTVALPLTAVAVPVEYFTTVGGRGERR